jgi:hypothetical protein
MNSIQIHLRNRFYYFIKPLIPARLLLSIRRRLIQRKLPRFSSIWPIDETAGTPPIGWKGWPQKKRFAFVLMHDVDSANGLAKCRQLMAIDEALGFRSSFNIVPADYFFPADLRLEMQTRGFEVGVHGLKHDGKMFNSPRIFHQRARQINSYLHTWGIRGFSSPSMLHRLSWMHALDIDYDISTFDTDPFEPQPDGVRTIFPFKVKDPSGNKFFIELPYTMPQDFTLFILMENTDISIWKRKIDWIASKGGMALFNSHPDYMWFDSGSKTLVEYPSSRYAEFLQYVKSTYADEIWHVLPKEVAAYYNTL